jgi:hypothetical protein
LTTKQFWKLEIHPEEKEDTKDYFPIIIKPKAKAEATKHIPAPVSLFVRKELIAKMTPIHPVTKALVVAEHFILNPIKDPLSSILS